MVPRAAVCVRLSIETRPMNGSAWLCNLPGLEVDVVAYTTVADAFSKAYFSDCEVQLAWGAAAGWQA